MKVYGELVRAQLEILQSDPSAGIEGRIWFNDVSNYVKVDLDGTNIAVLFNSQQTLLPANTAIDLGSTAAPFQNIYGNVGIIYAPSAICGTVAPTSQLLNVGNATNPLTGASQQAISTLGFAANTAADSGGASAFRAEITTLNKSYTVNTMTFYNCVVNAKGAASTIGRITAFGTEALSGVGALSRCVLADNTTYTGNWFINQAGTDASLFGGTVQVAQLIDAGLTATTVPYVNSAKQFTSSAVTPTELGYVSGVTSSIQTQLSAVNAAAKSIGLLANVAISTAVTTSNDLVISLVSAGGTAISTSNDAAINFRSSTLTSGQYVTRALTAPPTSLTVPKLATLGQTDAEQGTLLVWAIDNAGTVELGISADRVFDVDGIVSTTAIDTSSDQLNIIYSASARVSKAVRLIGSILQTQTTAGTWASAGTSIQPNQMDLGVVPIYERGTFTANFNQGAGASGSSTSKTVEFVRVGRLVTLYLPDVLITCGATAAYIGTSSAVVPRRLRPDSGDQYFPCVCQEAGALQNQVGKFNVSSLGLLRIYRVPNEGTNFTSGDISTGMLSQTITYYLT